MEPEEPRHLVVGRLRKPHGLKGDCAVFPLTDAPARVFAPGRSVWLANLAGDTTAGPLVVARSRPYHREWLIAFRDHLDVDAVKPWSGRFVTMPASELEPPEEGEVYLDELAGFSVRSRDGDPLGLVSGVLELPAGITLEIQGPRREFLLPFKKEFVVEVDRPGRRLIVDPPAGLLDL